MLKKKFLKIKFLFILLLRNSYCAPLSNPVQLPTQQIIEENVEGNNLNGKNDFNQNDNRLTLEGDFNKSNADKLTLGEKNYNSFSKSDAKLTIREGHRVGHNKLSKINDSFSSFFNAAQDKYYSLITRNNKFTPTMEYAARMQSFILSILSSLVSFCIFKNTFRSPFLPINSLIICFITYSLNYVLYTAIFRSNNQEDISSQYIVGLIDAVIVLTTTLCTFMWKYDQDNSNAQEQYKESAEQLKEELTKIINFRFGQDQNITHKGNLTTLGLSFVFLFIVSVIIVDPIFFNFQENYYMEAKYLTISELYQLDNFDTIKPVSFFKDNEISVLFELVDNKGQTYYIRAHDSIVPDILSFWNFVKEDSSLSKSMLDKLFSVDTFIKTLTFGVITGISYVTYQTIKAYATQILGLYDYKVINFLNLSDQQLNSLEKSSLFENFDPITGEIVYYDKDKNDITFDVLLSLSVNIKGKIFKGFTYKGKEYTKEMLLDGSEEMQKLRERLNKPPGEPGSIKTMQDVVVNMMASMKLSEKRINEFYYDYNKLINEIIFVQLTTLINSALSALQNGRFFELWGTLSLIESMLIGGEPGAGKTLLIEVLKRIFAGIGKATKAFASEYLKSKTIPISITMINVNPAKLKGVVDVVNLMKYLTNSKPLENSLWEDFKAGKVSSRSNYASIACIDDTVAFKSKEPDNIFSAIAFNIMKVILDYDISQETSYIANQYQRQTLSHSSRRIMLEMDNSIMSLVSYYMWKKIYFLLYKSIYQKQEDLFKKNDDGGIFDLGPIDLIPDINDTDTDEEKKEKLRYRKLLFHESEVDPLSFDESDYLSQVNFQYDKHKTPDIFYQVLNDKMVKENYDRLLCSIVDTEFKMGTNVKDPKFDFSSEKSNIFSSVKGILSNKDILKSVEQDVRVLFGKSTKENIRKKITQVEKFLESERTNVLLKIIQKNVYESNVPINSNLLPFFGTTNYNGDYRNLPLRERCKTVYVQKNTALTYLILDQPETCFFRKEFEKFYSGDDLDFILDMLHLESEGYDLQIVFSKLVDYIAALDDEKIRDVPLDLVMLGLNGLHQQSIVHRLRKSDDGSESPYNNMTGQFMQLMRDTIKKNHYITYIKPDARGTFERELNRLNMEMYDFYKKNKRGKDLDENNLEYNQKKEDLKKLLQDNNLIDPITQKRKISNNRELVKIMLVMISTSQPSMYQIQRIMTEKFKAARKNNGTIDNNVLINNIARAYEKSTNSLFSSLYKEVAYPNYQDIVGAFLGYFSQNTIEEYGMFSLPEGVDIKNVFLASSLCRNIIMSCMYNGMLAILNGYKFDKDVYKSQSNINGSTGSQLIEMVQVVLSGGLGNLSSIFGFGGK